MAEKQMSNEQFPGCLVYIGDEKLPSYMGDYNKPLLGSLLNDQCK